MNSLTHFKEIRILPLFIAPALVIFAVLAAVPARATPGCGLQIPTSYLPCRRASFGWLARLNVQGASGNEAPVVSPHERQGRFGRLCHPSHVPAGGSDWVAPPPVPA